MKWFLFITAGLQELQVLVHVFRAPNNICAYTIVHLTFHAPRIVVCTRVYANMYLVVHLLET